MWQQIMKRKTLNILSFDFFRVTPKVALVLTLFGGPITPILGSLDTPSNVFLQ